MPPSSGASLAKKIGWRAMSISSCASVIQPARAAIGDLCQGFACNEHDPNVRDFFPMPAPGQKLGQKTVYYGPTTPEREHPVQLATVGDALARTISAAHRYYDLSFTVRAANLDKPFTLRFRRMSGGDCGAASIYAVKAQDVAPSIRQPVSGGLDLKF
jgi:hypothetical protein